MKLGIHFSPKTELEGYSSFWCSSEAKSNASISYNSTKSDFAVPEPTRPLYVGVPEAKHHGCNNVHSVFETNLCSEVKWVH